MQGEEVWLCGVIVDPTTVTGRTATVQGTVILTGPAPARDTNFALSSDNPDVVKVQPSVDVPEGSNSAGFTVGTELVNDPTPVAITASNQDVKQTATLTVQPPALTGLTLNPTSVLGGTAPQGTVQLNGPAPAGFAVARQSTDTSVATVPASITVPTDSASATFQVSTRPVPGTRQVDLVASRAGVSRSSTLGVQPPAPVGFAFSPQLIGDDTSTGRITLNGPAPGGTSVALRGLNTTTANFSAIEAVQPNATQVTFAATGQFFTGANRSVIIAASYLRGTRQAILTVEGAKEKEGEKLSLKEKEDEFLISGRSGIEGAGTDEESGESGGAAEGPTPRRSFGRPAERPVPGQQALDQPPAEE